MTREEVEEAMYQIHEYIKTYLQPQIPIGFRIDIFVQSRAYPDSDYKLRVYHHCDGNNVAEVQVTYIDGETHETRLTHGNLDKVSLGYKVELLKKWKEVKEKLLAEIKKEIDRREELARVKAAEEEKLCASVTGFQL